MASFSKSFRLGLSLCAVALSALSYGQAKAEVFFVEDQNDRFSITFPDTWAKISNQKPDDKLVIAGQGTNEFVLCRVRVREEGRFLIYPEKTLGKSVSKVAVDRDFWDNYLGDYNEISVESFRDEAGLGYGHASMVEASFETSEGTLVRKRGFMFASVYKGNLYVVDCSAEESVYDEWRQDFLSIIKSVKFEPLTSQNTQGHYRDFTDEEIEVEGPQELDRYKL